MAGEFSVSETLPGAAAVEAAAVRWRSFEGAPSEWDDALVSLGGDLYQSHAWGNYRSRGGWRLLRAIERDSDGATTAMAQILLRRRLGITITWIPGGVAGDCRRWAVSLPQFLRREFGSATYCRVNILSEQTAKVKDALTTSGWRRPAARLGTGLSLELDLRPSAPERMNLASANWRHNLRRSGKYGLTVERWRQPDVRQMAMIYRDMEGYKGLAQQHSETDLRAMIDSLGRRLLVFRCLDGTGNLLAFRAAGVFRERGWDLLAAAAPAGRKVYASHAVLWALLEACREEGARTFDLGGVDPTSNKGVFDFKRGTGARLIEYTGEWEWAGVPLLAPAVSLIMKYRGLAA
jgi:hypothetical protein